MSVAFFRAILGFGAAVYYGIQRFSGSSKAEKASLENPANSSKAKVTNRPQKHIEAVGIRLRRLAPTKRKKSPLRSRPN